MKSICVFGDSITWGAWDNELGGWVNRLRLFLNKSEADNAGCVYNLGIPGDNTNDLLVRFEVEALAREARDPGILIFAVGINDSIYIDKEDNHPVPLKGFEMNLRRLIMAAQKITDKILFLGLTKVDEKKTTPIAWNKSVYYTNLNIALYDSEIEKMAAHYGIKHLPLFEVIKMEDLEDGLHPDSKGHQKIFEAVKDFLMEEKWI